MWNLTSFFVHQVTFASNHDVQLHKDILIQNNSGCAIQFCPWDLAPEFSKNLQKDLKVQINCILNYF